MSSPTLHQIVAGLGSGNVTAFFLVLTRVSPLFVVAPLFSSRMVPPRVRGIIAVALSIGLTPLAVHGQAIPSDPLAIAALILEGFVCGLAFAFAVGAVFYAIEMTGAIADGVSGFSFGSQIDPLNGNPGGVLTSLYGLIGTTVFIVIGGDAWTLRGLARTFALVPLTRGPQLSSLVGGVESTVGSLFTAALEVAAPVLLALVITDVAFGMVSRVVPQLNVFAVGFPVKVAVALVVVGASLPFIGGWMTGQIETSLVSALHTLQVA